MRDSPLRSTMESKVPRPSAFHYIRKSISLFILFVMVSAAAWLLVLGPRADPDIPPNRLVIRYWEKWPGFEGVAMRQIVDDFNDTVGKEKNIYVKYMTMSQIDQKTLVAIAAGDPPDIAGLWDHEVAPFAAQGISMPLDDLAKAHGITEGYYKPVYWKGCHYNGQLHALISTPAMVALFYNQRIFHEEAGKLRKAGLDPDRAPRTLDELDRYASALDTFKMGIDGKMHLERAGYLPLEPGWWIYNTPIWFGTFIWNNDSNTFTLTDPRCTEAFNWVRGYSEKFGKDAITEFTNAVQNQFNSPTNPFMMGQVVMEQQGPWFANYIHQNRPEVDDDWQAAPFPSKDGRADVSWAAFDTLVIPKGTPHPDKAFEFIAYVNSQPVMEKLCTLHCKNSPLSAVTPEFIKNSPNKAMALFEELARSPNAYTSASCPINTQVNDEVKATVQELVLMQGDAHQKLQNLQTSLQQIYDDFAKMQARREGK